MAMQRYQTGSSEQSASERPGLGTGKGPPDPPEPPNASGAPPILPELADQLTKAGRAARADRDRVVGALTILVVAATAAVVAGIIVDQPAFWQAASPVFAAAGIALVAYGAIRLGVFAETAELLGRRASDASESPAAQVGGVGKSVAEPSEARTSAFRVMEKPVRVATALDVGEELFDENHVEAALLAFEMSAESGDAEGARRCALVALDIKVPKRGSRAAAIENLLLACKLGSPVAPYNLGAMKLVPRDLKRELLIDWALRRDVREAALLLGMLDASPDAVQASEIPRS